jgi:esterase/lipase superfamily enzyme
MRQLVLFLTIGPLIMLPSQVLAATSIVGFSGVVLRTAGTTATYQVLLYQGSSADAAFDSNRKLISIAQTDADGRFVILATDLPVDKPVTIRAKNAALRIGGDVVVPAPVSGVWPQVTTGISISLTQQSDPNFGIRRNVYATTSMFFVTDRAQSGGDFTNTAATDFAPSVGGFTAHVSLGNGQAVPGKCGIAPDWSCAGPSTMNDDAFIDGLSVTSTGESSRAFIRAAVAKPRGNAVLLFVHGYNNSFDQGAQNAARMSYLMDPSPHETIVYSWPSASKILGYPLDAKNSDLSAKQNLGWVLDEIANSPQHPRSVLVGHSMGAYTLTTALYLWALKNPSASETFSDLVLFAGDVDVQLWAQYQPDIARVVKRIKFYGNVNDQALALSTCTTGDNRQRVGQVTTWSAPVNGFDATKYASTNDFGHGYLDESATVAADWNQWLNPDSPSAVPQLRRLAWLADGGGSLINSGGITSSVVCEIFKHAF